MSHSSLPPDFVVIGHAARDLLPAGGLRLGGTVTYAALTAQRLGLRAAILTSGPPDLLEALAAAMPGIALATVPATEATTFENIYAGGSRRQHLRGRAASLGVERLPPAWREARIALLAPLAREVAPAFALAFPGALVAATPQGWLRRWDANGRVYPGPLGEAEAVLPALDALVLSVEDLLPPPDMAPSLEAASPATRSAAEEQIAAWARIVPLIAVTAGREGARLLARGSPPEHFPAVAVREVDPTGAGDVFAAAFLCRLHATGDARAAMRAANCVAGLSIEHEGTSGIPTLAEVEAHCGQQ